jgi:hypothetical protein
MGILRDSICLTSFYIEELTEGGSLKVGHDRFSHEGHWLM